MMVAACLMVSHHDIRHLLEAVEWDTLLFFACLFIIVEGLVELGLIRAIGSGLTSIIASAPLENRLAVGCLLFLWVSSLGSAFFESLPYTATMAAVLNNMRMNEGLGISVQPFTWALSVGACVGGIGSIMGSSANLVALAVSHRYSPDEAIEGHHFLKYGLPLLVLLTLITSLWQYVMFSVLELPGTLSPSSD
jgi:P protein